MQWRCRHRTIDLTRPVVMGILNVTPDSFSDGSRYATVDAALERAVRIADEGAAIIDVGGESTRPGAQAVEEEVEIGNGVLMTFVLAPPGRFRMGSPTDEAGRACTTLADPWPPAACAAIASLARRQHMPVSDAPTT